MTEKLKQIIKKEVLELPKEAQEAIGAVDWVMVAEEIGKKYLLTESEINDLQVETLLVLAGIEPGDLYTSNIENEVGTSRADAEKIVQEANQKIFTPIYGIWEQNIKKNLPSRRTTPEQNLNFILSGGDYAAFLEQRESLTQESFSASPPWEKRAGSKMGDENATSSQPSQKERGAVFIPSFETERSTSPERNKTNPSPGPRKMTDIKSKFTI